MEMNEEEEKTKRTHNTATILIGTFLEYFDLYLYVHMGIILQEYFFGPTISFEEKIWGAFYGWILSYAARPFGGLFFGYIGDNFGRKNVFIITTMLMGLSSFAIALLPGYADCGITATFLFIGFRLLQSLSAAGEFPGAFTYIAEINRGRKNEPFIFALLQVCWDAGGLLSLLVADICLMAPFEWAWRIPFAIGGFIAVLGSFARLSLKETPEWLEKVKKYPNNYFPSLKENIKNPYFLIIFFLLIFPIETFFVYAMGAKKLEDFGFSALYITQYNTVISLLFMFVSITMAFLTLRFNPIKLAFWKTFIALVVYPFLFWQYTVCSTANYFLFLQCLFVLFSSTDSTILYLYTRSFITNSRYTTFAGIWSFARLVNHILGSFLHTYFFSCFGYWGNLSIFIVGDIVFLYLLTKLKKINDIQIEKRDE